MHLDKFHIRIIRFYLFFTFVLAGTFIYLSGGNKHWVWWIVQLLPSIYLASFPFWQFRMEKRVLWLIVFLLVALFSTLANMSFSPALIILIKGILLIAGIWTFFAYFVSSEKEVIGLLKLLLFIACIQIIWVIPQYFLVRTNRIAQGEGITASDSVVGSFAGSMTSGGQSATFAFFQVCILIGLFCFRKYGVLTHRNKYITFMLLTFIPLLFTESKAIAGYFLLAVIILNASLLRADFFRFAYNNVKIILLITGLIVSYQYFHWSAMGGSLGDNLITSSTYIFSEETGYFATITGSMTRYQAILFWWDYGFNNVGHLLFGHGLSASYTLTDNPSLVGTTAREFMPKKIDTTGFTMLLWDVGVVGTLSVFAFLVYSSMDAKRLSRSENLNAWQRALAKMLQVVFLMFCLSLMYRPDIPYTAPMMVIFMLSLGLLSYISRNISIGENGSVSAR